MLLLLLLLLPMLDELGAHDAGTAAATAARACERVAPREQLAARARVADARRGEVGIRNAQQLQAGDALRVCCVVLGGRRRSDGGRSRAVHSKCVRSIKRQSGVC